MAEYIHFFRYVECAVSGDRRHNGLVVPDDPELNAQEIKQLLLERDQSAQILSLSKAPGTASHDEGLG